MYISNEKDAKMIITDEAISVLESIQDGIIVTDSEGCIVLINSHAELLTGFHDSDAVGRNLSEVFNIKGRDPEGDIHRVITSIKNRHSLKDIFVTLLDKNGFARQIEFNLSPLKSDSNSVTGATIVFRNFSERLRKKLEEKSKFELAIQSSGEVIFMTSIDGVINYVNPMFTEFYGYQKEEVLGTKPSILKSGFMSNEFYSNFWAEILSCKVSNYEIVNKTKFNSYVTIQQSTSPLFDKDNNLTGFISIQRDITEKKQNDELLRRALDKAEESDKLKNAFLNQMSHEIRTPLNSILGFMAMMEEELINRGVKDLAVYFDSINRSSLRLQRTIEDILAMSSIQIGNYHTTFTKLNLESIIGLLLKDYSSIASEKHIGVNFNSFIPEPIIYGDSYTVIQSFQHVIDNAFKFTHEGKVEVTITGDKESVCVNVIDTGIGISRDYMEKLFKPFSQEEIGYNRRYDGNGLGLAITSEYLRLNHAGISVKSEKGQGTTFSIVFYRLEEENLFESEI